MSIEATQSPYELFRAWFDEAKASEPDNPDAMALATVDETGLPSVRMVLLKGFDDRGFVFFTNLESHKGRDLRASGKAGLCFHWKSLARQVRADGPVTPVSDEEADAYFASRPRGSQIGAWASQQSRPMESKAELLRRVASFTGKFGVGRVPRPPFWSGFRIAPERIEFWRDGRFRLHDRLVYHRSGEGWTTEILYP